MSYFTVRRANPKEFEGKAAEALKREAAKDTGIFTDGLKLFPSTQAFVLEKDGQFVGFAGMSVAKGMRRATLLHSLYVLPKERSKGGGRMLTEARIAHAKVLGATTIRVNLSNPGKGIAAYKKMGFTHEGYARGSPKYAIMRMRL